MTIAVVGGTGPQGRGLAERFASGGHDVVLGSRHAERAASVAGEVDARVNAGANGTPVGSVRGAGNVEAVGQADVVVLAIPYDGHDALVAELAPHLSGSVVVSCVNPLGFDAQGPFGLDMAGTSAAESAQHIAPKARLVGAFHHLSAVSLSSGRLLDHEDVLVCGDDADAKQVVMSLATTITGKPGIDAGALRLARQLEPLTAVLISVNKKYKVRSGIAVAGLDG